MYTRCALSSYTACGTGPMRILQCLVGSMDNLPGTSSYSSRVASRWLTRLNSRGGLRCLLYESWRQRARIHARTSHPVTWALHAGLYMLTLSGQARRRLRLRKAALFALSREEQEYGEDFQQPESPSQVIRPQRLSPSPPFPHHTLRHIPYEST